MSKSEERYYTKEYWINDFPSEQISRFNNYIKYFEEYNNAKENKENENKLNKRVSVFLKKIRYSCVF